MSDLNLCLLETDLVWENPEANKNNFDQLMEHNQGVDVYVLPEMFTTGFTMHPESVAEPEGGETLTWMKTKASQYNAAITGSIVVQDSEGYRNRMYFVHPSGKVDFYDKRHLFSYAGEDKSYVPGDRKVIVSYKGWNILLQVCFDLRFPVFARNRIVGGHPEYDLIVYVANWPEVRAFAWESLLKARAIENISYVAGVNRIGVDGNEVQYSGNSALLHPLGQCIEPFTKAQLSRSELETVRSKFRFLEEQDQFELK